MRWDSRLVFLFAAIGSAVGLGNVWRFPYLTYKFGGGAFLLPYIIVLLLIGIPLLILEFAIGQKMQKGAVGAFKSIDRRFVGVGILAAFICFGVVAYYTVVMGWSLIYMVGSFHDPLPWEAAPDKFFFNNVLQITDSPSDMGSISVALVIALALAWIAMFFCVFRGVRSIGKVVLVSMPLPFILLLILFFRAITLDGALEGISYYIKPNFSLLLSPELWLAAITQVFFSLSVGFGVMIAYASFNNPKQSITRNAATVAIADTGLSLLAGFVVFGVLGHMALVNNIPIDEVVKSGPSLAFIAFPKALSLLPLAGLFSFIFFLTLFFLGIDSAFSLVEGITTVLRDTWRKLGVTLVAFVVSSLAFLSGLLFTTGAGLYFLDIVDHFITSYTLVIIGIAQCILVGWFYGAKKMRMYINSVSSTSLGGWWDHCIKWIIPAVLGILLLTQLVADIKTPYEGYPGSALAIGWALVVIPAAFALLLAFSQKAKGSA
jgi:NSS family neurotransmitter:Na+ symporter